MYIFLSNSIELKKKFITSFLTLNAKYNVPKDYIIYRNKDQTYFYLDYKFFYLENDLERIYKSFEKMSPIISFVLFFNNDFSSKEIDYIHNYCIKNEINIIFYSETTLPYSFIQEKNKKIHNKLKVISNLSDLFKMTRNLKIKTKIDRRIVLLGATGVGKSSFINNILENNSIEVGEKYTTEHLICNYIKLNENQNIELFDTIGLENKTKKYLNAIKGLIIKMDILILFTDILSYNSKVNKYILNFARRFNKTIILLINKDDLQYDKAKIEEYINSKLKIVYFFINTVKKEENKLPKTIITEMINDVKENIHYCDKKLSGFLKLSFPAILFARTIEINEPFIKIHIYKRNKQSHKFLNTSKVFLRVKKFIDAKYCPIKLSFK